MRRRRIFVTLLVLLMAFGTVSIGLATELEIMDKSLNKNTDANQNKIFDNLEFAIQNAADSSQYDVIIVFNEKYNLAGLKQAIGNFTPAYEYQTMNALAGTFTKGQITALAHMPQVKQIQLDQEIQVTMESASRWFGVYKARKDWGYSGDLDGAPTGYSKKDVVIAVLDTGIDGTHVDLDNGKIIGWRDLINNQSVPYDDHGHGTHVAGIAAGSGDGDPDLKGVAYGAALVGVKVLNANGSGQTHIIDQGIEWIIQNQATYNIRIMNISFGNSISSDGTDSTSTLVNQAFQNGILPVVSAGNGGPAGYTIGTPGAAKHAVTVGNMVDPSSGGFYLSHSSGRGYTADRRLKPDIIGPGHNISAPKAKTTNGYITMSGSSMSAPFVAGTAALMIEANPPLTPSQLKDLLCSTAQDWGHAGADLDYGHGRLQAHDAIEIAGGHPDIPGPTVPYHANFTEDLPATGFSDYYKIYVYDSSNIPLAVTLIMEETSRWPDFDLYIYDPNYSQIASSTTTSRQEVITLLPTTTGWYTIRVYAAGGSGQYALDLSAESPSAYLDQDDYR